MESDVIWSKKVRCSSKRLAVIQEETTREPYLWLWATPTLQRTIGQYRTTDVAENLGKSLSGAQRTAWGKDFEVILMVKMETRRPVRGPFGRKFLAFVIIAELQRPEVTKPGNFESNFCVFW